MAKHNNTLTCMAATSRQELTEDTYQIPYTPRTTKRGSYLTGAKGIHRHGEPQPHQVAQAPKQIPAASKRRQSGINTQRKGQGRLDLGGPSSRGSKLRDPITLTPEILAMLERHEPDKRKEAQLLTEHLAGQRVLPSAEEELQHYLERKAKRETNRILAI